MFDSDDIRTFATGYQSERLKVRGKFCLTIVPCVPCYTILSDYSTELCLVMLIISILSGFLIIVKGARARNINLDIFEIQPATTSNRPFKTNFRALTNITTAVCILAVDFQIFSRKYAKTEDYGFSLMDTGVGLFVIPNALVAPEARDFSERPRESLVTIVLKNSKACVRNCTPLLIFGFGRISAIEYLGYQKQGFGALSTTGLKEWVLGDAPRNDFVSANREDPRTLGTLFDRHCDWQSNPFNVREHAKAFEIFAGTSTRYFDIVWNRNCVRIQRIDDPLLQVISHNGSDLGSFFLL